MLAWYYIQEYSVAKTSNLNIYINQDFNIIFIVQDNSFTIYIAYNKICKWKTSHNNVIMYASLLSYI